MKTTVKSCFSMEYTRLLGWIPVGVGRSHTKEAKKHIKRLVRRGHVADIHVPRHTYQVCVKTRFGIFHSYTVV